MKLERQEQDPPAIAWLRAWLASPHPPHGERRLSSGEVGSERQVLEAYDALRNAAPDLLAVVRAAKEWLAASDSAYCAASDIHWKQSRKFKAEAALRSALAKLEA